MTHAVNRLNLSSIIVGFLLAATLFLQNMFTFTLRMRQLLLILLCLPFNLYAQSDFKKNVVYGELAGAAYFYSINIERSVAKGINVRFGAAFNAGEPGALFKTGTLYLIPGLAYLKPIGDNGDRFIEIGAGLTNAIAPKTDVKYDLSGYMNFGYRKEATEDNPIFWRVTFTPLLFRDPFPAAGFMGYLLPWFGVALGYGF